MNIILALSVLFGNPQASMPAEDDYRNEVVWDVAAGILGQDSDRGRLYEAYKGREGLLGNREVIVYVGTRVGGAEATLGAYWSSWTDRWTPLMLEGD